MRSKLRMSAFVGRFESSVNSILKCHNKWAHSSVTKSPTTKYDGKICYFCSLFLGCWSLQTLGVQVSMGHPWQHRRIGGGGGGGRLWGRHTGHHGEQGVDLYGMASCDQAMPYNSTPNSQLVTTGHNWSQLVKTCEDWARCTQGMVIFLKGETCWTNFKGSKNQKQSKLFNNYI